MGRKKSKKSKFGNLTQIGERFGLSAIKVGEKMKEMGLREAEGQPSAAALKSGLAIATPLSNGIEAFKWHKSGLFNTLVQTGMKPVSPFEKTINSCTGMIAKSMREGKRLESEGHDKMAIFVYEQALMDLGDVVNKIPMSERGSFLGQICDRLVAKKLNGKEMQRFVAQVGVPECEIELGRLDQGVKQPQTEQQPTRI